VFVNKVLGLLPPLTTFRCSPRHQRVAHLLLILLVRYRSGRIEIGELSREVHFLGASACRMSHWMTSSMLVLRRAEQGMMIHGLSTM
jgi:hypothetical protein